MSIFKAIILGIVQGLTEFLPVSSSGHLAIMKNLLHLKGKVISIDPDFAIVSDDKTEEEYKFYANDLKDFKINDK